MAPDEYRDNLRMINQTVRLTPSFRSITHEKVRHGSATPTPRFCSSSRTQRSATSLLVTRRTRRPP